jgi:hypothetical protein
LILLFLKANLTTLFYTLSMINKISAIIKAVIESARRIIDEECRSLDAFYAQYE